MSARPRDRAAFAFAWMRLVKRHPHLSRLDAWTAIDLVELVADDRTVFRSAAALGAAIRCTRTAAAQSLGRLVAAGLLEKTQAAKNKRAGGGRPASAFRLCLPAQVLPIFVSKTPSDVLPTQDGKTDGVLPTQNSIVLPTQEGTNTLEDSGTGREGAQSARPASDSCDTNEAQGEHGRAPCAPLPAVLIADAAAILAALPAPPDAPEKMADDLFAGFVTAPPNRRAATNVARALAAIMHRDSEGRAWREFRRATHRLALQATGSPSRADSAVIALCTATAAAAQALDRQDLAAKIEKEREIYG